VSRRRLPVILALGTAQTLGWASSVYLPAILADPIAHDLGISANWIFGAYSGALVIAGLLGPRIGRQIDRVGGRPVLSLSSLTFAGGLVLLGFTQSIPMLLAAWLLLGIGMGYGLYDAAFGALGRIYGENARGAITGITLMAGFASTIGWPLSAYGLAHIGWRDTCFAWAAAHILIGLPLNLLLPAIATTKAAAEDEPKPQIPIDRTMALLALAFALVWIVTGAMAAQFPRILEAAGATRLEAIAAGALIGPAQVLARLLEIGFLSRYHPIVSAKLAFAMHPLGALIVALTGGAAAASLFAVFHGAGNGVITIARGTLPLSIFGPKNYAYRLGLLGAPARMAQAPAPLLFGFLIDWMGSRVLIVSSALSLIALGALFLLRLKPPSGE
jgi:MFS family permease